MLTSWSIVRYVVSMLLALFPFFSLWADYGPSPFVQGSVDSRVSFLHAQPVVNDLTFSVGLESAGLVEATELDPKVVLSGGYGLDFSMGWPARARAIYQYHAPSRPIALGDERLARALLQEIGESVVRVGLEQRGSAVDFLYARQWNERPVKGKPVGWFPVPSIFVLLITGLLALLLSRRRVRR
jgi:hypothetical protein